MCTPRGTRRDQAMSPVRIHSAWRTQREAAAIVRWMCEERACTARVPAAPSTVACGVACSPSLPPP
eukprot:CAMPEP_0181236402 /NCGR_PEP_ID=MMETSP1096-20121128/38159_1 /TAXON_ID=156174 ORGANISM="Chrysochromulina ericina, Strain CCMP281" /NCGR_SAMPLE_ID=MMETSP1096 /ASSEMBLY_ACC=CAM_ASM_000453 /LENGTH=65 /DNA_ID=CAMNT_0023331585 /DNA_START=386 /DNA_END=579 /DNA_ORIENTATION=+